MSGIGGSVDFGSATGTGSGASTFIAEGATFLFFRSSIESFTASVIEMRAIPLFLSTQPLVDNFS